MPARSTERSYSRMFRMAELPIVTVDTVQRGPLALTHLRCSHANHGRTAPYAPEATYMVSIQLQPLPPHTLLCNDRRVPLEGYAENTVTIYDLREQWQADMIDPFEVFHFHIPHQALAALHEDHGSCRLPTLACGPDRGKQDPILRNLAEGMRPTLRGAPTSRLFSEHVLLAMSEHVAMLYGGLHPHATLVRGGLSPAQERRAREYLLAHLAQNVSLADVARTCNLSVSHFVRAFRRTTGHTPHQWLTIKRVEEASQLLCRDFSLADVALECGFADQSHLSRAFTKHFGVPPGRWRRTRMERFS